MQAAVIFISLSQKQKNTDPHWKAGQAEPAVICVL
jgi:hypothetical protein